MKLSEVFRYVKIAYRSDRTRSELKVVEARTSFTEVEDPSPIGFHKLITDSIQQKGLDFKNCRGQGYDGAAVMSGKYCTPACIRRFKMWLHMLHILCALCVAQF